MCIHLETCFLAITWNIYISRVCQVLSCQFIAIASILSFLGSQPNLLSSTGVVHVHEINRGCYGWNGEEHNCAGEEEHMGNGGGFRATPQGLGSHWSHLLSDQDLLFHLFLLKSRLPQVFHEKSNY